MLVAMRVTITRHASCVSDAALPLPSPSAPLLSSPPYRGSNADYLVLPTRAGKTLERTTFCALAVPVLNQRFPAPAALRLEASLAQALVEDEPAVLDAQLAAHALRTAPLPKSLYDALFTSAP